MERLGGTTLGHIKETMDSGRKQIPFAEAMHQHKKLVEEAVCCLASKINVVEWSRKEPDKSLCGGCTHRPRLHRCRVSRERKARDTSAVVVIK